MEPTSRIKIGEVVRSFLLPTPLDQDALVVDKSIEFLTQKNIDEEDQVQYLVNLFYDWKYDGNLDSDLEGMITFVLSETDNSIGALIAEKYFALHTYLASEPFFSFELSSIALSHLRLIHHCAVNESMSASKITSVLQSVDKRLSTLRWRNTQKILNKLGCEPSFTLLELQNIYNSDIQLADFYFADSTMNEASEIVGEVARKLNFSNDLGELLNGLIEGDSPHKPYLQILHYQCAISAFYDHGLTTAYEFSPRGTNARWLFDQWQLATGNPILNNAKAVDTLNFSWASARKPAEYPSAQILVDILVGMDQMGFIASKELATWIRRWLVRYIQLETEQIVPVLTGNSAEIRYSVLSKITESPTQTYGILEQRLVDLVAAQLHSENDWRARGLSDSVNANNFSKAKLGDCDFQDSENRSIIAYEAHGGKLTQVYLDGHIKTLHRSLRKRSLELYNIEDPEAWSIKVVFVAYDFGMPVPESIVIDDYTVNFEFVTFENFLANISSNAPGFVDCCNQWFCTPINEMRTPHFVRSKVSEIISTLS
ncbi:MAG: hypothetical protein HRT58_10060 [Crocinitomicaceae bacterium]|nr:hypothetical protein [Flavobacteriales bacterium]NQZ35998.1 hypothetical protein [Crocinitomicaceae bacterium]